MRAFAFLLLLPLAACGFRTDDPELDEALYWVREFKAEQPDLAREFGQACKEEIGQSPWSRDGSLALFRCIRAKAEARGYSY